MNENTWKKIVSEIEFRFSRSSGPGGQHVNRTESKVELRWDLAHSEGVTDQQKNRLMGQLKNHLKGNKYILIQSEKSRHREQNRRLCLLKLREMLEQGLKVPKKRLKTHPTKVSITQRLESKKIHGKIKKIRQKPSSWDD